MHVLRSIVIATGSLLLLSGCGEGETAAPPSGAQTQTPAGSTLESATSGLTEAAKEATTQVTEKAEAAVENVKEKAADAMAGLRDKYGEQIEGLESKFEGLKATAATLKDDTLSGLVESLGGKLEDARGALSGTDAGSAEGKLSSLMGEIPKLFEQATARVSELKGSLPDLPGAGDLPGSLGKPGGG